MPLVEAKIQMKGAFLGMGTNFSRYGYKPKSH